MEDQGRADLPDLCTTCLLQNSTEIPCGIAVSYFLSLPIMQEVSLAVLYSIIIIEHPSATQYYTDKHKASYLVPFPPEG